MKTNNSILSSQIMTLIKVTFKAIIHCEWLHFSKLRRKLEMATVIHHIWCIKFDFEFFFDIENFIPGIWPLPVCSWSNFSLTDWHFQHSDSIHYNFVLKSLLSRTCVFAQLVVTKICNAWWVNVRYAHCYSSILVILCLEHYCVP